MSASILTQWPSRALTIIDAGDEVAADTIAFTYEDQSDPTRTATVTLSRVDWDVRYMQSHPSHIDMPLDSFVAVRLIPENGDLNRIPCWIYGGSRVEFTALLDGFGDPILDGEGYPTYSFERFGLTGPDISSGNLFTTFGGQFQIGVNMPLDSPWGERGVSISMSGSAGSTIDEAHETAQFGVDFTSLYSVNWFARAALDGTPISVPVNTWSFTRAARKRHKLGGYRLDPSGTVATNIRIDGARWEPRNRTMTFTSPSMALAVGMCLARAARSYGITQADAQIAALVPGTSLTMSAVPSRMGGTGQRAYVGGTAIDNAIAYTSGGRMFHASAGGFAVEDEVVWGLYDWDTSTWSEGSEVIGKVAEVIDSTSFRIVPTTAQREAGIRTAPSCWYGTMWAHDGAVDDTARDEEIDIADDGVDVTVDGFTCVVS